MTRLRIQWVRSLIGYERSQRRTVKALGLRRLHQTVEHEDTPTIRGMLHKVRHLVRVAAAEGDSSVESESPKKGA
jgi:large subunit ribosomal protein L30